MMKSNQGRIDQMPYPVLPSQPAQGPGPLVPPGSSGDPPNRLAVGSNLVVGDDHSLSRSSSSVSLDRLSVSSYASTLSSMTDFSDVSTTKGSSSDDESSENTRSRQEIFEEGSTALQEMLPKQPQPTVGANSDKNEPTPNRGTRSKNNTHSVAGPYSFASSYGIKTKQQDNSSSIKHGRRENLDGTIAELRRKNNAQAMEKEKLLIDRTLREEAQVREKQEEKISRYRAAIAGRFPPSMSSQDRHRLTIYANNWDLEQKKEARAIEKKARQANLYKEILAGKRPNASVDDKRYAKTWEKSEAAIASENNKIRQKITNAALKLLEHYPHLPTEDAVNRARALVKADYRVSDAVSKNAAWIDFQSKAATERAFSTLNNLAIIEQISSLKKMAVREVSYLANFGADPALYNSDWKLESEHGSTARRESFHNAEMLIKSKMKKLRDHMEVSHTINEACKRAKEKAAEAARKENEQKMSSIPEGHELKLATKQSGGASESFVNNPRARFVAELSDKIGANEKHISMESFSSNTSANQHQKGNLNSMSPPPSHNQSAPVTRRGSLVELSGPYSLSSNEMRSSPQMNKSIRTPVGSTTSDIHQYESTAISGNKSSSSALSLGGYSGHSEFSTSANHSQKGNLNSMPPPPSHNQSAPVTRRGSFAELSGPYSLCSNEMRSSPQVNKSIRTPVGSTTSDIHQCESTAISGNKSSSSALSLGSYSGHSEFSSYFGDDGSVFSSNYSTASNWGSQGVAYPSPIENWVSNAANKLQQQKEAGTFNQEACAAELRDLVMQTKPVVQNPKQSAPQPTACEFSSCDLKAAREKLRVLKKPDLPSAAALDARGANSDLLKAAPSDLNHVDQKKLVVTKIYSKMMNNPMLDNFKPYVSKNSSGSDLDNKDWE